MKNNNQISISWDAATQISIQEQQEKIEAKKKQAKNVERANSDLWNSLGSPNFRMSDFEDICYLNGIDTDDLLDRII